MFLVLLHDFWQIILLYNDRVGLELQFPSPDPGFTDDLVLLLELVELDYDRPWSQAQLGFSRVGPDGS